MKTFSLNLEKQLFHDVFDFFGYLLACAVLVWRAVQAKAGEGCETARKSGGGSNARSREETAMLRRLVYIYKEVLDFALC